MVPAPRMRAAAASPERSGCGRDGGHRHAPNKAALHDGAAETVLAQLNADSADPRPGRAAAHRRPRLPAAGAGLPVRLPLLVTPPLATPLALRPLGTLRLLEHVPTLLTRAGFSGPDALNTYPALLGFLHGHILNSKNSSTTRTRPTTRSASACTGCRPARSPCAPRTGRGVRRGPGPAGVVQAVARRRRPVHPGRGRRPARHGGPRRGARPRAARRPGPAPGRLRDRGPVMTAAPPPLAPGLAAGLHRLKLAAMRQLAPELLITTKTQRRAPEELPWRNSTAPRPRSPAPPWTTSPPWNGSPPREPVPGRPGRHR
jgi:hypothetical protein